MAYAAKHYVTIGKKLYTPGEVIDEKLDGATVRRLTRLNAIKKLGKAEEEPEEENPQQEAAQQENPAPDGGEDEETSGEEEPSEEGDEAEEEDTVEEDPAPEIDVMDAVVTQPEAEEKPKPKSTRKTGRK